MAFFLLRHCVPGPCTEHRRGRGVRPLQIPKNGPDGLASRKRRHQNPKMLRLGFVLGLLNFLGIAFQNLFTSSSDLGVPSCGHRSLWGDQGRSLPERLGRCCPSDRIGPAPRGPGASWVWLVPSAGRSIGVRKALPSPGCPS